MLYLEGSTDLAILRAFAGVLEHPAKALFERPFVQYVGNVPSKAREHFYGLLEAKPDLVGFALFDADVKDSLTGGPLWQLKWGRREIENYLCYPETLIGYASQAGVEEGPLFQVAEQERRTAAMQEAISEVSNARRTLRQSDPFAEGVKASDECFAPIFQNYFDQLGIPNLMQKTDYHTLVRFVPKDRLSPEITEKLNVLTEVARQAKPLK